jgi:hypothetical protein
MQSEVEAIGREIFARMAGAKPKLFSHSNLTGQLLEWSMQKEALKMQLFRLVDVLPVLDSNKEIARHVAEYLGDSSDALPPAMVCWDWPPGPFSHRTADATCCPKDRPVVLCAGPDRGNPASARDARPLDSVYRGSAGRNGLERARSGGICGPLPRLS